MTLVITEDVQKVRLKAVSTWLALGNLDDVARVIDRPIGTVKKWRYELWWKEIEAEIRAGARTAQTAKVSAIVEKGLDVVDDRLTNGELVLNNKTGELMRKQVSLRDAANATSSLMQRQAILEKLGMDETATESSISIQDQLQNLAKEFAKFNNRSKAGAEDIEFKETADALHDQRETGLQEGTGEILRETRSNQEAH